MRLPNGYELTTTLWNDFSLIDGSYESEKIDGLFGILLNQVGTPKDIKEQFNLYFNDFKERKDCCVSLTEFVVVLNLKSWFWFHKNNKEKTRLYTELWVEAKNYAETKLKGKEKEFYFKVTD